MASFRNVARGICRVLYSAGVGQGGTMLTLRFDVPDGAAAGVAAAMRQRLLPPLADAQGIAGVHLCRADDQTSRIETAEKKARSEGTQIPRWIALVEGMSDGAVATAAATLREGLLELGITQFDQASYRLEYRRCKLPGGDA